VASLVRRDRATALAVSKENLYCMIHVESGVAEKAFISVDTGTLAG
jgi:hypothetical protein